MKLRQIASFLSNDLDEIIATVGIILSVPLIIYAIWNLGAPVIIIFNLFLNSLFYGILIFSFCFLWLVLKKDDLLTFNLPESKYQVKFWAICFFILFILSILAVYARPNPYERPLLYFVLTILMAGAITLEVNAAERRYSGFILIQILLLGISLAVTLLPIVPSLIGGDPWYHSGITSQIIDANHIPDGYMYSTEPAFHLISAMTSVVTTMPYKFATMASVSFGQIAVNAIFVFLIANYLFKNHRIGLLAALLVIIGSEHIARSIAPIPNSFGSVFVIIILYLIITRTDDIIKTVFFIPLILLMWALILTHGLSAFLMALCFIAAWGGFKFYQIFYLQKTKDISFFVPVFFIIALLFWWYYVSIIQTTQITQAFGRIAGIEMDFPSVLPNIISGIPSPIGEIIFARLGLYLFFSISSIGLLYMFSRKGNNSTLTAAFVFMVPVCIYTILTFFGGDILGPQPNFLIRWIYFAQIFISIPLAFSIYSLGTYKLKNANYISFLFFGFIIVLSVLMIMPQSGGGSQDINIFSPSDHYWSYYTESEMTGTDFFAKKSVGIISSDREYAVESGSSVFINLYSSIFIPYKGTSNRLQMLDFNIESGTFQHDGSIKIFRSRLISEFQRIGVFSPNIQPDLQTYMSKLGFDKIYDSPTMTGYIG